MRLVISDRLDPAAAAVQAAHVAALAAATPRPADRCWDSTTMVAHTATPTQIGGLIAGVGGNLWESGEAEGVVWFCEPDRLWEPTAVAVNGHHRDAAAMPLYAGAPATSGRWSRRDLIEMRRLTERRHMSPAELWTVAANLGDQFDVDVRARAVWLVCRGEEPPMA